MNHVDLVGNYYDKHEEAFRRADTFAAFIESADITDQQRGFLAKYADGWAERSFRTHKLHGFVSRPLAMPEARSMSDLFDAVELKPLPAGGRTYEENHATESKNRVFVSSLRGKDRAYFGTVTGRHYIRTYRDGRFFCFGLSGSQSMGTYAQPKPALVDVFRQDMIDDRWFSVEFIDWEDGRCLVTIRDGHMIGSRWVTILPKGESLVPMLPEADQQAIAAWLDYDAKTKALVDGDTVNLEAAKALGVEVRADA